MVPPNLLAQASKLQKLDKKAIIMSSESHIIEIMIYSIMSGLFASSIIYYILTKSINALYGGIVPLIVTILYTYIISKNGKTKDDVKEHD